MIVLVMVTAGALALEMARHLRRVVILYWREALVLMLAIVGMLAVVENEFYTSTPVITQSLTGEQGRYAFTVLVPLVALALCGLLRFKRERAMAISAVVVAAMICFAGASHLLYLADTFT